MPTERAELRWILSFVPEQSLTAFNPKEWIVYQPVDLGLQRWARKGLALGYLPLDILFDAHLLNQKFDDFQSARHEIKHKKVIKGQGGEVSFISVIPGPGYRAITKTSPNPAHSSLEQAEDSIVAALGSSIDDEMEYAYDFSGRGSDLAVANQLAIMVSAHKYGGRVSPAAILEEKRNLAHFHLSGKTAEIEQESWSLMFHQQAA